MDNQGKLIGLIAEEDTVVGFLMGGIGEITYITKNVRESNYLIVHTKTPISDIEECFNRFVKRPDIDIILIQQNIAERIRFLIDSITTVLPTILEIPSKDSPYDANKDSILSRARGLFNPRSFSLEQE